MYNPWPYRSRYHNLWSRNVHPLVGEPCMHHIHSKSGLVHMYKTSLLISLVAGAVGYETWPGHHIQQPPLIIFSYVNTRTGVSSAWAVLWNGTFVFTGILQTSCFYTLWMAIITPFSKWLFMIKGSLFWNTRETVFRSPILSVVYNKVYVYLEIWKSFIPWKFPTIPLRQWNRNPVHITESVKFQKLKYNMVVY